MDKKSRPITVSVPEEDMHIMEKAMNDARSMGWTRSAYIIAAVKQFMLIRENAP